MSPAQKPMRGMDEEKRCFRALPPSLPVDKTKGRALLTLFSSLGPQTKSLSRMQQVLSSTGIAVPVFFCFKAVMAREEKGGVKHLHTHTSNLEMNYFKACFWRVSHVPWAPSRAKSAPPRPAIGRPHPRR